MFHSFKADFTPYYAQNMDFTLKKTLIIDHFLFKNT